MSTSSDDDAPVEETGMGKILDIRDRLPPHIFGDNPTGNLSVRIFEMLINDPNEPYVHLAALILVSRTLQRLLSDGHKASEDQIRYVWDRALEIADNTRVEIGFKDPPKGA